MKTKFKNRRTWKMGRSIVATLPYTWCKSTDMEPGDELKMMMDEDGRLIVEKEDSEVSNSG